MMRLTHSSTQRKNTSSVLVTFLIFSASVLFNPSAAFAQSDAATIAELRAQINQLSARLEQLESQNSQQQNNSAATWVNNIEISGDLRTRYENIDDNSLPKDRNRNRIRARLDVSAQANEDWAMSLGLASGNDDPISTNQTLGAGSTSKNVVMDYAYFEYTGLDSLTISGGKYKNIFYRAGGNAMVWDGDYRPEGLAVEYAGKGLFMNLATMILESDDKAGAQDKESMWGAQLGYRLGNLTFGAGYFDASVKGSMAFYDGDLFGNSADASGAYLYDYEELELFAEYAFIFHGLDLSLFGDVVQNQDANTDNNAWTVGTTVNTGLWELGYSYQDLEADAVFATFTDSDFGGGGTDAKGHIISAEYAFISNTSVGFTYFINEGISAGNDYDRLMLDLSVSF